MRGLTPTFRVSSIDEQFDERRFETTWQVSRIWLCPSAGTGFRKLQARVLAGDYRSAIEASSKAQPLLGRRHLFFETAEYEFYGGLSSGAFVQSALSKSSRSISELWPPITDSSKYGRRIARKISRTAPHWSAQRSPGLKAAKSRPSELYEQAIRSARANGFVHNEALAYELAGALLRSPRLQNRDRASLPG